MELLFLGASFVVVFTISKWATRKFMEWRLAQKKKREPKVVKEKVNYNKKKRKK